MKKMNLKMPKLLRQPSHDNRIYVWSKELEKQPGLVPVGADELVKDDNGNVVRPYAFNKPKDGALTRIETVEDEEAEPVAVEPEKMELKAPSHMNKAELLALNAEIATACPDAILKEVEGMRRADMLEAVQENLKTAKEHGFER